MTPLILPWPPRELHPNARVHWARRAKLTKLERRAAFFHAKAAKWDSAKFGLGGLLLRLDFYPPDRRRRDLDGCLSASKAQIDGIADALGVDDSRFSLHVQMHAPRKGGEVHVTIQQQATP